MSYLMAGSPVNRVLFIEDDSIMETSPSRSITLGESDTCNTVYREESKHVNTSSEKDVVSSPDAVIDSTEDTLRRHIYQHIGRKPFFVDTLAKNMTVMTESIKYIVDDYRLYKTESMMFKTELKEAKKLLKDLQDQRESMLNAMNEAMSDADKLSNENSELRNTNASLAAEKNQALALAATLNEEMANMKGELSTLKMQLSVWNATDEVLKTAPVEFLRRTSDKMQGNANVLREAAIRREAITAAAQEVKETQANNDASNGNTCVICYENVADMMSDVCHRITVCKDCSMHMIVCPHCDQNTTFTQVFY